MSNEGENEILLHLPNNDKSLIISQLTKVPPYAKKIEVADKEDITNSFSSFIPLLSNVMTSSELAKNQYYRVVSKGALVTAKNHQNGFRAWAVDESKKINSQAVLYEPENLEKLINFSTAFNAVSMIVGQKHLSDINDKLNELCSVIQKVSNFQQQEREAKILYFSNELKGAAPLLVANKGTNLIRELIVQGEHELGPIQLQICNELNSKCREIEKTHLNDISKAEIQRLIQQWCACFESRIMAAFMFSAYSDGVEWSEYKLSSLDEEYSIFRNKYGQLDRLLRDPSVVIKKSIMDNMFSYIKPTSNTIINSKKSVEHVLWKKQLLLDISNSRVVLDRYSQCQIGFITLEVHDNQLQSIYY